MKLKRHNESPVGGWWIRTDDGMMISADDGGLTDLISRTRSYLESNGMEVPADLSHWIQDQICQRQPKDRCVYTKGLGDKISQVVHGAAHAVDRVLGTHLESAARTCRKCGSRRMKANRPSR